MSLLKNVTQGRKIMPICAILYGVEGIGKSSFGANAPSPILIGGEDNDELDVPHYKITPDSKNPAKAWEELKSLLKEIRDGEHGYKTLAIDTLDSLEPFCHDYVLRNSSNKNMVQALGGYQAAYKEAAKEFINLRDEFLVPIRARGINILLLAHSLKNKFEDPITQSAYDTYEMKLHKYSKPIFTEWVSTILFANFNNYTSKDKETGKRRIVGDGERIIYTEKRPSHDAKNRFNLPFEINLDYKEFSQHVKNFYMSGKKPETPKIEKPEEKQEEVTESVEEKQASIVRGNIQDLLESINDADLTETMGSALERAGTDIKKLEWIQGKLLEYKQS
jgi:hypothetical protein